MLDLLESPKVGSRYAAVYVLSRLAEPGDIPRMLVGIYVYGADPEPVPNANVTVMMSKPDGSSETITITSDANGIASGEFTIFVYGAYTLTVENIEAEGMVYTPDLNAKESLTVNVSSGDNPLPATYGETIPGFATMLAASFRQADVHFLFDRLHPAVLDLYGEEACRSYLSQFHDPTFTLRVESYNETGDWIWERDERQMELQNAFAVQAYLTAEGDTSQVELHYVLAEDGTYRWLTDCGDPLE